MPLESAATHNIALLYYSAATAYEKDTSAQPACLTPTSGY